MGELIILVWHSVALGLKLMSSTIPAAYRQLKHVLSLLVACPPSHQFQRLSYVLDFLLVVFLHVS